MSTNDFVKYLTQQVVRYLDEPKEKRREKRTDRKDHKPPLSVQWFGLVPMAISMLLKRK